MMETDNTGLNLKYFFQRSRFSQRFLYVFCLLNLEMYLISLNQVKFLCNFYAIFMQYQLCNQVNLGALASYLNFKEKKNQNFCFFN